MIELKLQFNKYLIKAGKMIPVSLQEYSDEYAQWLEDKLTWKPVEDKLPEQSTEPLLCKTKYGSIRIMRREQEIDGKKTFYDDWGEIYQVTHWMEIPE